MSQPKSKRRQRAQAKRTKRHEEKRRVVRNAYRPRTTAGRNHTPPMSQFLRGTPMGFWLAYLEHQQRVEKQAA